MCKKNAFKKHVDLLLEQEKQKSTMFSLQMLTHSCTIIFCIVKDCIFVVIISKLLAKKKD